MNSFNINRREMVLSTAAAMALGPRAFAGAAGINLVPDAPSGSPDYFCTWSAQYYQALRSHPGTDLATEAGTVVVESEMNEKSMFGPNGQARRYYPRIRKDVFFLLDDGWMSALAGTPGAGARFQLDEKRFPSFSGNNLALLNRRVRELGWRGTGIWCSSTPGGERDRPLVEIIKNAGIGYCKIDGGDTPGFTMRKLAHEMAVPVLFEHAIGEVPLNGDWKADGRLAPHPSGVPRIDILKGTDVFRVYDTSPQLAIPTTLDRVAQMLDAAQQQPQITGLLNVDDEAYIAAALGCTTGILRHPVKAGPHGEGLDAMSNGPRKLKMRIDETVRAVLWHRIAPPYAAGQGFVRLDTEIFTDSWNYRPEDMWWKELYGHTAHQGAPARIARNMELPEVSAAGPRPFVAAARYPNGAVSVASLGRATAPQGWAEPRADVTLNLAGAKGPIGVFGHFASLKLAMDRPLTGTRWLAQDLLASRAIDISRQVHIDAHNVTIPGELLARIGLSGATRGDLSDPGLVLAWA